MSQPSLRSAAIPLAGACVLSLLLAGCGKSEAATNRGEKAAPVAQDGAAAPKVTTENYTVELRASGAYAKGQEGTADLVIETKGDYHINDQYPYKFTPKPNDAVAFKGPVGREGGQFDKTRAVMKIPFTPAQSGSVKVAGKISLSVCSDKNCLMEKQDLELPVTVN